MRYMYSLLFLCSILLSATASAQALYDYSDGTLTAQVELSAPLPTGTTTVTPLSLTLSAGPTLEIDTGLYGAPFGVPQSSFTLGSSLFQFTTDAAGNITGWNMDLTAAAGEIETLQVASSQNGDTVTWANLGGSDSTPFTQVSHYTAGAWVDPPLAVPEINAAGLPEALTLLIGLLLACWNHPVDPLRRSSGGQSQHRPE